MLVLFNELQRVHGFLFLFYCFNLFEAFSCGLHWLSFVLFYGSVEIDLNLISFSLIYSTTNTRTQARTRTRRHTHTHSTINLIQFSKASFSVARFVKSLIIIFGKSIWQCGRCHCAASAAAFALLRLLLRQARKREPARAYTLSPYEKRHRVGERSNSHTYTLRARESGAKARS